MRPLEFMVLAFPGTGLEESVVDRLPGLVDDLGAVDSLVVAKPADTNVQEALA